MLNLEVGYSFKIAAIDCNTGNVCFWKEDLPELNKIVLAYAFNFLIASSETSGHPLLATVPLTSTHLSSLSATPSPSVSGQGQPAFSAGPLTSTHLSTLSATPSPSVSGQPFIEAGPA